MSLQKAGYEQGPIRPPSEAGSLLVRLTRNCPWNRCLFCPVYKGEKFGRRSLEDISKDIKNIAFAAGQIRALSLSSGYDGKINRQTLALIQSEHPALFQLAFWLFRGGENVFLQDGDSLLLPVPQLKKILNLLKTEFPSVKRITSYARSRTLTRRSVEELVILKNAGLTRIHVGMESGNDEVLAYMKKGATSAQHIEAGVKVKAAGLSLSEYVIPGLGGKTLWHEHAVDSAVVLNKINPDFIRLRTLAVPPGCPLYSKVVSGEFILLDDDGVARELALFIETLEGIDSYIYSDHILNLFEDLAGKLPDDKADMLGIINSYFSMTPKERELYRLGRRAGYFRTLADLNNKTLCSPVEQLYSSLKEKGISVDSYIRENMLRFI